MSIFFDGDSHRQKMYPDLVVANIISFVDVTSQALTAIAFGYAPIDVEAISSTTLSSDEFIASLPRKVQSTIARSHRSRDERNRLVTLFRLPYIVFNEGTDDDLQIINRLSGIEEVPHLSRREFEMLASELTDEDFALYYDTQYHDKQHVSSRVQQICATRDVSWKSFVINNYSMHDIPPKKVSEAFKMLLERRVPANAVTMLRRVVKIFIPEDVMLMMTFGVIHPFNFVPEMNVYSDNIYLATIFALHDPNDADDDLLLSYEAVNTIVAIGSLSHEKEWLECLGDTLD